MLHDDEKFRHRDSLDRMAIDVPGDLSNGVDVYYAINGDGTSTAVVDTKNGNVWVDFVLDNDIDKASCWPSCTVI